MGKEKQPYYCFQCGDTMEELPHLPKEILSTLIVRFGCQTCNFIQEKNYMERRLSLSDYCLNYEQYKEELLKNKDKN